MKKVIIVVIVFLNFQSCIPLRIAPTIQDYKITKGKKFKRSLPKRQMFIFTDTKEAEHFYNYVNTKFQLKHIDVYDNVPFKINENQFFFSFYEVTIDDKSVNLATPVLATIGNKLIQGEDDDTEYFSTDTQIRRSGNYYIAMEVYSDTDPDSLQKNSINYPDVLSYLRDLKKEYLATHNYNEVLFKN